MTDKEYSASLVSKPFWYLESRQTAELMSQGKTRKEIRDLAVTENIYQCKEEYRAVEIFNTTYRRLSALPPELIECVATADRGTSKMLLIIAIMMDDRLFCEFMNEEYKLKIHMRDYKINSRDLNRFFVQKSAQSDIVSKWTEYTVKKLKATYLRLLSEGDLLTKLGDEWEIHVPLVNTQLREIFSSVSLNKYLSILLGGE